MSPHDSLPDDVETLKRLLLARDAELALARAEVASAQAEAASARAEASIQKPWSCICGWRSRNSSATCLARATSASAPGRPDGACAEELEAAATEDEVAAEKAAATTQVRAFTRMKPARKPFPAHLPRERVVVPGPTTCSCCGSSRLAKLGENVTETLEVVPRQWKVVQTVREKFTCRDCERISQAAAPFFVLARGFAGGVLSLNPRSKSALCAVDGASCFVCTSHRGKTILFKTLLVILPGMDTKSCDSFILRRIFLKNGSSNR